VGIASLAVIWVVAAIVLLSAKFFFFDRDSARLKAIEEKQA